LCRARASAATSTKRRRKKACDQVISDFDFLNLIKNQKPPAEWLFQFGTLIDLPEQEFRRAVVDRFISRGDATQENTALTKAVAEDTAFILSILADVAADAYIAVSFKCQNGTLTTPAPSTATIV
jgi:hypothetical protein